MTSAAPSPEQRWRRTIERRHRPAKLTIGRLLREFGYADLNPSVGAAIEARLAGARLTVAPSLRTASDDAIVTIYVRYKDGSAPAAPPRSVRAPAASPPRVTDLNRPRRPIDDARQARREDKAGSRAAYRAGLDRPISAQNGASTTGSATTAGTRQPSATVSGDTSSSTDRQISRRGEGVVAAAPDPLAASTDAQRSAGGGRPEPCPPKPGQFVPERWDSGRPSLRRCARCSSTPGQRRAGDGQRRPSSGVAGGRRRLSRWSAGLAGGRGAHGHARLGGRRRQLVATSVGVGAAATVALVTILLSATSPDSPSVSQPDGAPGLVVSGATTDGTSGAEQAATEGQRSDARRGVESARRLSESRRPAAAKRQRSSSGNASRQSSRVTPPAPLATPRPPAAVSRQRAPVPASPSGTPVRPTTPPPAPAPARPPRRSSPESRPTAPPAAVVPSRPAPDESLPGGDLTTEGET